MTIGEQIIQWPDEKGEQIIQWPNEKGQKDQQMFTKQYTENYRLSKANPSLKLGMNSNVSEWYEFPAPLMASVVLLLHDTTII
jgi:hypothetical protein